MTIGSLDIFPKTGGGTPNINGLTGYPLTVPHGGTGATSFTTGGILIGEGTSPIQSIPLSNGQLLIGSTGSNPVPSTLTAGTGISITNAAGSITITNTSASSITFDTNFAGMATPIAGILNLLGSGIITTTGLGNTVTIDTIPLTNGQLFIGSGGTPVAGSLTPGNGITITPGAGSITISASSAFADQFDANSGMATPSGGILNLLGSGIITTTGSGNTVTIQTTSLSNGQLFIGSGGTPVAGSLTPGNGITITPGAGSITISASSAFADQFDANSGMATPTAGILNLVGSGMITTTATGNTVTIESTPLTDGQLFIGSGGTPVASTLTAGTGISIVDAAGSITISNTSASSIQFDANSGMATPTAGILNLVGSGMITTTATGNTVTIESTPLTDGQLFIGSGGTPVASTLTAGTGISIVDAAGSITISSSATGLTWVDATMSTLMASNTGYIADGGSLITLTLPASPALGDVIRVAGFGAGGWKIAQNALQQIIYGSDSTTAGTGGSLQSSDQYDCVELVFFKSVSGVGIFVALSAIGNITVV